MTEQMEQSNNTVDNPTPIVTDWVKVDGKVYNLKTLVSGHQLLEVLAICQQKFTGNIIAELLLQAGSVRLLTIKRAGNEIVMECMESCASAFPMQQSEKNDTKPEYIG